MEKKAAGEEKGEGEGRGESARFSSNFSRQGRNFNIALLTLEERGEGGGKRKKAYDGPSARGPLSRFVSHGEKREQILRREKGRGGKKGRGHPFAIFSGKMIER